MSTKKKSSSRIPKQSETQDRIDELEKNKAETASAPAETKPVEPPAILPLMLSRFTLAEEHRNSWQAFPVLGTTIENMLEEKYWAHLGHLMRVGDHIEALAEDGSWYVEFVVRASGRLYAQVAELFRKEWDTVAQHDRDTAELAGYSIEYGGQIDQWRVLFNGGVLKKELPNKTAARRWVTSHVEVLQSSALKTAGKQAARL